MDLFKPIKQFFEVQEMRGKLDQVLSDNKTLIKQAQFLVDDILTVQQEDKKYVGNTYTNYDSAIKEIAKKYNSEADWGSLQTGNIVDLRSAFIISNGIKIVDKSGSKTKTKEVEWTEDFLRYNDLDREGAQVFAVEGELEGKILVRLALDDWDEDPKGKMVSARFISYLDRKYTIEADPEDYMHYVKATWKEKPKTGKNSGWKAGNLSEDKFVYKKFGGRISDPNKAQPKIMKCLNKIEDLDKALRDLREINKLFASPTPHIQCDDMNMVKEIAKYVENINWKIKKFLAHTGELMFLQPDSKGVDNLISEISTAVKMISGTTGVPIHFLGLLDLLKNKSTGENTREMVIYATTKERQTWRGAFEEMITKGMHMYNDAVFEKKSKEVKLDPRKIEINLPVYTQEQWDHLEKVLLPACLAGKISDEYFLSQIPDMDMQVELKRKEEKEKTDIETVKRENEDLKSEKEEEALFNKLGVSKGM